LNDAVAALAATEGKSGGKPSILILARYRFLRPDVGRLQRQNPRATITFKTIHASKGLEADHVIILGADTAKMGFPSMIVDDPLLSLVSPEAEPYPNAEERRVMYVAVTRARRTVTILASEARPSVFVEELMKEPEFGVAVPLEVQQHTHTCPGCGGRLLHMAGKDGSDW
jgi:DNA helicase-4